MSGLNLKDELLEHYQKCKQASDSVFMCVEQGQNLQGAASFINATTTAIDKLVKLETELYNVERAKQLEQAIIAVLSRAPNARQLLAEFEQEMSQYVN